jgi:hypothetical protein
MAERKDNIEWCNQTASMSSCTTGWQAAEQHASSQIALSVHCYTMILFLTLVSGHAQQIFFFGFSGSDIAAGSAALPNFHQDIAQAASSKN